MVVNTEMGIEQPESEAYRDKSTWYLVLLFLFFDESLEFIGIEY